MSLQWNTFTVSLLCWVVSVCGQFNTPFPCSDKDAQACIDSATQSVTASGCNWYRIVPPMMACVDKATMGCKYEYQEDWKLNIADFNKSLQTDECYPACTNQAMRADLMFGCFTTANFDSLVNDIHTSDVGPGDLSCQVLSEMNDCVMKATANCPALTDVSHDRINSVEFSAEAFIKCRVPVFASATTNAPLDLLNTRTVTAADMAASASSTKTDKGQLILIILGSIVIAATIIVIIIVICITIRRRRAVYRRSILKDWRPNGQQVYRDEPQFVATAAPLSAYRPLRYTNQSGFLNEAVVVD